MFVYAFDARNGVTVACKPKLDLSTNGSICKNEYIQTRFKWQPEKAVRNLRKHKISFESAIEVFSDPNHLVAENYLIHGEQRQQVIGMTRNSVLLLVIFVDRSEPGIEVIYIISARKGESQEERIYEEQIS